MLCQRNKIHSSRVNAIAVNLTCVSEGSFLRRNTHNLRQRLLKIRQALATLAEKRVQLVKLIHEPVPEAAAHQAAKFQRIAAEMNSFVSVLHEVTSDFNNYYEEEQSKFQKSSLSPDVSFTACEAHAATFSQVDREVRH